MKDEPLINLKDLIELSYDVLPGPYFMEGRQLFGYDKFHCKVAICEFSGTTMTDDQLVSIASMFMMTTPAAVRDMSRRVLEAEEYADRYRHLRLHGLYDFKNMTGAGLDTAVDAAINKADDED